MEAQQHVERSVIDRRQIPTDFNRRKYDRRTKTFTYERSIHLRDTNMYGSVYFAEFFSLQGECREEFFQYLLDEDVMEFMRAGYNIVTINAHCDYKGPLHNGDKISVNLQVTELSPMRGKLEFTILNKSDESVVATGYQTICLVDSTRKPLPVPEVVIRNMKRLSIL